MKKLFLFMAISLVSLHEVYSQDYQVADSIVEDAVLVDTIAQDSVYFTPKDSLFLSYISDVADYIVESIVEREELSLWFKMLKNSDTVNVFTSSVPRSSTINKSLWKI